MNPVRKANLLIMIIIAIVGLGVGNVVASFTGDYFKDYINLNSVSFIEDSKMLTVEDGQFSPVTISPITTDKQQIPQINTPTTIENNTTDANDANNNNTSSNTPQQ